MRLVTYYGSAALVALILGASSAWWAIGRGLSGGIEYGAWRHYPHYGSAAANPYVRARTQLAGPLALDRSEAVYFIADTDSNGRTLRSEYTYRIEGRDFDARWWSITAYGADHHLIPNPHDRYSYNSADVARNADDSYTIYLSTNSEKSGNWIPTGSGKTFELFLRLYNPSPEVLGDVSRGELPRIIREDQPNE